MYPGCHPGGSNHGILPPPTPSLNEPLHTYQISAASHNVPDHHHASSSFIIRPHSHGAYQCLPHARDVFPYTGVRRCSMYQSHSCLLGHSGCSDTAAAPYLTSLWVQGQNTDSVSSGTCPCMDVRLGTVAVSVQVLCPYRHRCNFLHRDAWNIYPSLCG